MWRKEASVLSCLLSLMLVALAKTIVASVSYDHKSIIINGQKRILISGSIHYPRSTPEMWPDLIRKAKEGGVDVIQTYVFWNGHEPSPGNYYFEGRYDLVRFIKLIQQAGLYVHLRIGPYACAEWNFGGFPIWLKYVPGISFRTDNEPFKDAMKGFTQKIVNMMKAERLFETQGGPIILSQIENEYGPEEWEIGAPGKAYTAWAANMAVSLGTGVPWVMCKQDDAPDPVINACNGYYCDWFTPNKPYKPKMWTEAWTGWYTEFGGAVPHRPAEDMAFSVARFIQKGGSFVNYYMYHGGTNFGRTAGGPFIATSYDYDAPLDEYGMIRQPKWGHLKDLHRAIKLCEPALVSSDPTVTSLGNNQEAHVFTSRNGACAAFLANYDERATVTVNFHNRHYILGPWSISILPDCTNVVYNTAKIGVQTSNMQMVQVGNLKFWWGSYNEEVASYNDDPFTRTGLLEQLNVTKDTSDYLWYLTDVNINGNEQFLKTGQYPVLTAMSAGHALHAFVNGKLAGSVYGSLEFPKVTLTTSLKLWAGSNRIALLSVAVGLPNVGHHFETWNAGVLGPIVLTGLNEGKRDLTWQKWSYKVGLKGESMNLHTLSGSSSVEWIQGSYLVHGEPMTWYKATFDAPWGSDPLALDMGTMGKGQIWINGQSIGRYWPAYTAKGNCGGCSYVGTFNENKCRTNCGEPSQRWYHVPRSWLRTTGNLLVIFEEFGGNPSGITLVRRTVGSACADVSEWHPTILNIKSYGTSELPQSPKVHLSCTEGQNISSIKFASFGTPQGTCGSFAQGACHSPRSYDIFEKRCVGQQWCYIMISSDVFEGDPCPGVEKRVTVEAICS